MSIGRVSPGACPICGEAHSACKGTSGPITAVMAPARDAAGGGGLQSDKVQAGLPPGQFTTGTYRGQKKGLKKAAV